jgi:hypothetical protein
MNANNKNDRHSSPTLYPLILAIIILFISGGIAPTHAQNTVGTQTAEPGACPYRAPTTLLPQEQWAWNERICLGKPADMREYKNAEFPTNCDTKAAAYWVNSRRLTSSFFSWVIPRANSLYPELRINRPIVIRCGYLDKAVDMAGLELRTLLVFDHVYFSGNMTLTNIKFDYELIIVDSVISGVLELTDVQSESIIAVVKCSLTSLMANLANLRGLSLDNSNVSGNISLNSISISGPLLMRHGQYRDLDLTGSVIGGGIELSNSSFGNVHAESTKIEETVVGNNARMLSLDIGGSRINGNVNLTSAVVRDELSLNGTIVSGSVSLEHGHFDNISLYNTHIDQDLDVVDFVSKTIYGRAAKIDGNIVATGAKIKSADFASAQLGENFSADGLTVSGTLSLNGARIGGALLIRSGGLLDIDLQDVKVAQNVELSNSSVRDIWAGGAQIDVNANLDTMRARLVDFTSAQLGANFVANGLTVSGTLILNGARIGGAVLIRGAGLFDIDLQDVKIVQNLELSNSSFRDIKAGGAQVGVNANLDAMRARSVDFSSAQVTGTVLADGAIASDGLNFRGALIGGSVLIRDTDDNKPSLRQLILTGASITGALELTNSVIDQLYAYSVHVGKSILASGGRFGTVDLGGARIDNTVLLDGARVLTSLSLNSSLISGVLFLRSEGNFNDIDIVNITVSSGIDLSESTFSTIKAHVSKTGMIRADNTTMRELDLASAKISGDVTASNLEVFDTVNLRGATVTGVIELANVTMNSVDFENGVADKEVSFNASTLGDFRGQFCRVRGRVALLSSNVKSINIGHCEINGPVYFKATKISEDLTFEEGKTTGSFSLVDGSSANKIDLAKSNIEGDVWITHSSFGKALSANEMSVGGDLTIVQFFQTDKEVSGKVDFDSVKVTRNFILQPVAFDGLIDLSRSVIGNRLRLESEDSRFTLWGPAAMLVLRAARTGSLESNFEAWKTASGNWIKAVLAGFVYDELRSGDELSLVQPLTRRQKRALAFWPLPVWIVSSNG